MKRQPRTPDILRKSHAHKSGKDYSRKNSKSDWFDEHVEVLGFDDDSAVKNKLKKKFIEGDDTVTDTDKDKLNITFEKTWPMNYHDDYYATRHGWKYLGSDKKYDYYVNHEWKLTSIVYGPDGSQYLDAMYAKYITRDNEWTRYPAQKDIYPYTQLRKLLEEN